MSLCIVTAFLDIGRQSWSAFTRSLDQYFNNFHPYTKLNQEIIVFIDDSLLDVMTLLCKNAPHIKLIPINRGWMHEHIHAYRQLDREREIMESERFRKLIQHRAHHPECCKPEYNIMQHAKIDFIVYAIQNKLSNAEYYAWSDFGYFQTPTAIPTKPLNLNKFDLEKINFSGISPLTDHDSNILFTLTQAPTRIGGGFFLGKIDLLLQYQKLYHEICRDFHRMGIVDDDQHVMIQSVFRAPSLIHVWNLGGWFLAYTHFQN